MRKFWNRTNQPTRRRRRGQSMTEFAIFVSILFLIVAGMVDFGRAFFYYNALRDAAGEGAFYGSYDPSNTAEIIRRVRYTSDTPIDLADTTDVAVNVETFGNLCAGNTIRVTVTYQMKVVTPFVGMLLGGQTFPLSASIAHTILNPACV